MSDGLKELAVLAVGTSGVSFLGKDSVNAKALGWEGARGPRNREAGASWAESSQSRQLMGTKP